MTAADTRPRMACCGELDLGPPERGGRPFQCLHDWKAWKDHGTLPRASGAGLRAATQQTLGLVA